MKVLTVLTACVIIAMSAPAFSQTSGASPRDKDGVTRQNTGPNNPAAGGSSPTAPSAANPGSASSKGSTAGSGTGTGSAGGGGGAASTGAGGGDGGREAELEALADRLRLTRASKRSGAGRPPGVTSPRHGAAGKEHLR